MQVVVTRPVDDAPGWAEGLLAAGHAPWVLPLIAIGPVPDASAVQAVWKRLSEYHALMFVSGNAVSQFFALKPAEVPTNSGDKAIKNRAWATGPGTVRALMGAGLDAGLIDAPARDAGQFDSEALWAVVREQVQPGAKVLIVRGAEAAKHALPASTSGVGAGAGRDWLATQLTRAGVTVDFVVAYQRGMPALTQPQMDRAMLAASDGSVWLFSSSEALANLQAWLPGQSWASARAVATHARIAVHARQAGFGVVCESRPLLSSVVASIESMG